MIDAIPDSPKIIAIRFEEHLAFGQISSDAVHIDRRVLCPREQFEQQPGESQLAFWRQLATRGSLDKSIPDHWWTNDNGQKLLEKLTTAKVTQCRIFKEIEEVFESCVEKVGGRREAKSKL